jgi:hypothetical protein
MVDMPTPMDQRRIDANTTADSAVMAAGKGVLKP